MNIDFKVNIESLNKETLDHLSKEFSIEAHPTMYNREYLIQSFKNRYQNKPFTCDVVALTIENIGYIYEEPKTPLKRSFLKRAKDFVLKHIVWILLVALYLK